ncbi:MAG: cytochrome c3 family protein, partial [Thermoleophilia bacterium]
MFAILLVLLSALLWTAPASAANPHGGYGPFSNNCTVCHSGPHAATGFSAMLFAPTVKEACYVCHDGTGSVYDVVAGFGDTNAGTSTLASHHPVPEGILSCSDCHTPHEGPPGNPSGLSVGPSRLKLGNEVCGYCHGVGGALPGGDMVSLFTGTAHDTKMDTPSSGSDIKCVRCHAEHGSSLAPLIRPEIVDAAGMPHAVTGVDKSLCYGCHQGALYSYAGRFTADKTKHLSASASVTALTGWPGTSYGPANCMNCHEPHGKTGIARYARAEGNDLCFTCHDDASTTKPAAYSYRGRAAFESSGHKAVVAGTGHRTLGADSVGFQVWEGTTEPTPTVPGAPVSAGRLAALEATDGTRLATRLSVVTGGFDYQMYRFKVDTPIADLRELRAAWTGFGEELPGYETSVSIWDRTLNSGAGGWEPVQSGQMAVDTPVRFTRATVASYVDPSGYVYLMARARNAVDATIVSGPEVTYVDATTVTVSWKTLGRADSYVDFGPTAAYGTTVGSATLTSDHSVTLVLPGPGPFHFQAHSTDADAMTRISADAVFLQPAPIVVPVPDTGSFGVPANIGFAWSVPDPARAPFTYQVNVWSDSGFAYTSPWLATASLSLTLDFDAYHWRVVAKDKDGALSPWSAVDTFLVFKTDTSCPIL